MKYLVQFSTPTCAPCNVLKTKINKLIQDKAISIEYLYVNLMALDTYGKAVKDLWKQNPGLRGVPAVAIVNEEDGSFGTIEFFDNLNYKQIIDIENFINEFTNTNEA